MARIYRNTVQNHRQNLKFLKRRCVHEFVVFLRNGIIQKQNILGPSTRRAFFISATIGRFPDGFKKVFRDQRLRISEFSVWAMWNTLRVVHDLPRDRRSARVRGTCTGSSGAPPRSALAHLPARACVCGRPLEPLAWFRRARAPPSAAARAPRARCRPRSCRPH